MSRLKRTLLRGLTAKPAARAVARFNRDVATVFMLHRFSREARSDFTAVELLRRSLRFFRDEGIEVVTLQTLFRRLGTSAPGRMVVLTVDDGYADFHDLAAPVLAEHGVPATVFLTTGFLDGTLWQWWDRVEWSFGHSVRDRCAISLGGQTLALEWVDAKSRGIAVGTLVQALKAVSDDERVSALERLFDALAVSPPAAAPEAYRAMDWEQVRALQARGIEFSPHTVTHPILSRTSAARARQEIAESTARCTAELGHRPTTFCYPDGTDQAYSQREVELAREVGFECAVVANPGYVSLRGTDDPFRLRRFSFPEQLEDVIQIVSGLERWKRVIRREHG